MMSICASLQNRCAYTSVACKVFFHMLAVTYLWKYN